MRYGYGIPTPSGQSGGGSGSTSIPLRLKPVVAFASEYGWLNAIGEPAGYLESVSTLRNAGTGADGIQLTESSRPTCLAHDGENYLHCPGVAGNYASVPDEVALDITGSFTLDAEVAPNVWNPGSILFRAFGVKGDDVNLSYGLFQSSTNGRPCVLMKPAGGALVEYRATADTPFTDRTYGWIRAVFNVVAQTVTFYTSFDGVAFSQLGAVVPTTGFGSAIESTSAAMTFGGSIGAFPNVYYGGIKRFVVYADTVQVDRRLYIDFSTFADRATSGTAVTGQTVTINQSGGNTATLVGRPLLRLDGFDDRFTIPGTSITGPKTFVAVMRLTSKASQLAWSVGNADAYAWDIESGSTSANTDSPPTGVATYRKNGAPVAISNRDDLYDALQSQRVLLVSTYTFSSVAGDLDFGGVSTFGGFQLQGDIEKILAYPRILPNNEIEMLEAYLLG